MEPPRTPCRSLERTSTPLEKPDVVQNQSLCFKTSSLGNKSSRRLDTCIVFFLHLVLNHQSSSPTVDAKWPQHSSNKGKEEGTLFI